MNTSQNNSAQNSEQPHPKTIDDLRQAFVELAFSYNMLNTDLANSKAIGMALDCLESDCEKLAAIAEALRLQAKVEREKTSVTATVQTGQYQNAIVVGGVA